MGSNKNINRIQKVCNMLEIKIGDLWFGSDGSVYHVDKDGNLFKKAAYKNVHIPDGIQKLITGEISPVQYWNSDECEDAIANSGIGHDIILTDSNGDKLQLVWDYGLEKYVFLTRLNKNQADALCEHK